MSVGKAKEFLAAVKEKTPDEGLREKAAAKIGMPILAGTELNTPGQKLVDDFNKDPLALYLDDFLLGAEKVCRRFA